jgi:shikimate dehydrogenase
MHDIGTPQLGLEKGTDITAKTKILAVIGDPIEHSMSPKMHNAALRDVGLDYVYIAYHVLPKDLENAVKGFRALQIQGVNVTIPHKVNIMQYLDEIEPTAQKIGAINTIKNENGFLKAKNTDAEGALKAIKDAGFNTKNKKAVVIGAGGAARAITFFLCKEIDHLTIINRAEDFHFATDLCARLKENYPIPIECIQMGSDLVQKTIAAADLLINTTSVGMSPNIDAIPIEPSFLHPNLFVFDIVYNPIETKLLKAAAAIGCKTLSGIDMFVNQGLLAFEWWTGHTPNKDLMKAIVLHHLGLK